MTLPSRKGLERNVLSQLCIQSPLSSGLETAFRALSAMIMIPIILISKPFLFIYLVFNSYCNGFPTVMICRVKSGFLFLCVKTFCQITHFTSPAWKAMKSSRTGSEESNPDPTSRGTEGEDTKNGHDYQTSCIATSLASVKAPLC